MANDGSRARGAAARVEDLAVTHATRQNPRVDLAEPLTAAFWIRLGVGQVLGITSAAVMWVLAAIGSAAASTTLELPSGHRGDGADSRGT